MSSLCSTFLVLIPSYFRPHTVRKTGYSAEKDIDLSIFRNFSGLFDFVAFKFVHTQDL